MVQLAQLDLMDLQEPLGLLGQLDLTEAQGRLV
jgi:hypothetical protein